MLFQFLLIKLPHLKTGVEKENPSRRLVQSPDTALDGKLHHKHPHRKSADQNQPLAIYVQPPEQKPHTQIHHLNDKEHRHKPRRVIQNKLIAIQKRREKSAFSGRLPPPSKSRQMPAAPLPEVRTPHSR